MPRTCPPADATLCTYVRCFARPAGLRLPGPLVVQPLSAPCMRILLRFRMGSHSLPIVLGRPSLGGPGPSACASSAICTLFMMII